MNQDYEFVRIERQDRIGYLVLDRPSRLNALTNAMMSEFSDALTRLEEDPDVRVIVVRGEGRAFCAGYDMIETTDFLQTLGDEAELVWIDKQRGAFERLWRSRKPTIAQVHGHCVAGGASMASFCDIVVAAEDAQLGQPESVEAGYGMELCLWPITIGPRKTKELLMTGETVSGAQAMEMGMINHSVPASELSSFVLDLATRISKTHPQMLHYSKRLVNQVYDAMGVATGWEFGNYVNLLGHHSEAMKKFLEVRDREGLQAALKTRGANS